MSHDYDESEMKRELAADQKRFREFDCPDCNANNPHEDGFVDGAEVRCFYCGAEFRVIASDSGRLKFKSL